jgi:cysteinyl-tRNA synthetase
MAHDLLGAHFDIHGGGNDLLFPHHENEIAQSKCAGHEFANVWMHNEMLQVEGKKMSKSLGNFFTVRDLLDQGVPGEVIRFVMLSTHYRKPMDWTEKKREEAESELDIWANTLLSRHDVMSSDATPDLVDDEIVLALSDDLNTSLALTLLKRQAKFIDNSEAYRNLSDSEKLLEENKFVSRALLLGFDVIAMAKERRDRPVVYDLEHFELSLSYERAQARDSKDFSRVDALKAALLQAGVEVRMSKDSVELSPTSKFDPEKLEALK